MLWKQEAELSSEVEKLKVEIVKAEKSMDLAAPGVSFTIYLQKVTPSFPVSLFSFHLVPCMTLVCCRKSMRSCASLVGLTFY